MGTNFYAIRRENEFDKEISKNLWYNIDHYKEKGDHNKLLEACEDLCYHMNRFKIHIGKSSCGYKFLFNSNDFRYYDHTRESINRFLCDCKEIVDEYGFNYTVEAFWEVVDNHKEGVSYPAGDLDIAEKDYRFSKSTEFC
jgi:hypothetical protein